MAGIDISKYAHSEVHNSIATKDYDALKKLIAGLPVLRNPNEIRTEADSFAEEDKVDQISAVINRRDVPNRETPLHLAVKLGDETAAEMLMLAGVDWRLRNEQGWSALQEAICKGEEGIAMIIVRHYPMLAWSKWCRRLPRLIGTMRRMRDFYMEITFHFESSAIPFVSRIAPSDTYKIWKRGAKLRTDMTLSGFDGLRIQRSDQTILFLGDGSEDGKVPPGALCVISHKNREVFNAFDDGGAQATDEEIRQEVATLSRTNIIRPGLNLTQAVLLPQITWRRQEKTEMVGAWKAKVYDMHNVVISMKTRRVPRAMTDEEMLANSKKNEPDGEELDQVLTEEEKRQLEMALKSDCDANGYEHGTIHIDEANGGKNAETKHGKKGWFGGRKKRKNVPPRSSLDVDDKADDLHGDCPSESQMKPDRHCVESEERDDHRSTTRDSKTSTSGEFKKGLRPVLWLSPNFPLHIEEVLPLLDMLANKVKAIRRLRELLTTKLPAGTFPVKVAIPVVPTIRVLVSFTKFEELPPEDDDDEFSTPPSSPQGDRESSAVTHTSGSSWIQWMKAPYHRPGTSNYNKIENLQDPFMIPQDYTWITAEEKLKKMQEKMKAKKAKNQNQAKK